MSPTPRKKLAKPTALLSMEFIEKHQLQPKHLNYFYRNTSRLKHEFSSLMDKIYLMQYELHGAKASAKMQERHLRTKREQEEKLVLESLQDYKRIQKLRKIYKKKIAH